MRSCRRSPWSVSSALQACRTWWKDWKLGLRYVWTQLRNWVRLMNFMELYNGFGFSEVGEGQAQMLVLAFCVSEPHGESQDARSGSWSWMTPWGAGTCWLQLWWTATPQLGKGTVYLLQGKPREIKATVTFVPHPGLGGSIMVAWVCIPTLLRWQAYRAAFVRGHPCEIPTQSQGCAGEWGANALWRPKSEFPSNEGLREFS